MKNPVKTIIVRMPNWIGDFVMATPILADLRTAYPDAEITAMCSKALSALLAHDPAVDEVFCFSESHGLLRRISERNIVAKLRKGNYDLGILLTNSFSSAWRFWQGKVKYKLGFQGDGRRIFLDKAPHFPDNRNTQHLVLTYKHLLHEIGVTPSQTVPRLILQDSEIEKAWDFVKRFDITRQQTVIGVNPGAAYGSAKCWLPDRFREVARQLIEADPSHVVLFFGDMSHKSLIADICQGLSSRVVNLAGKTTIRELMALMKICSAFLTNDSGPMHMGDSLGVPLVSLFGSTDPIVTAPYTQRRSVIRKTVSCAPCFKRVCPIDFRCMKSIEVDEVFAAMMNQIKHKVEA